MKGEETNSELEEGSQWKFLASSNLLLLKKAAPQASVTERIEHSQVSASCEKISGILIYFNFFLTLSCPKCAHIVLAPWCGY